jgi:electron transfer flavoprotein beta subunit
MNIIVCMKQTAIIQEEPLFSEDGLRVDTFGLARHINEWDAYALEEALLIQKARGGEVLAITVGPEQASDIMVHAVAAGSSKAIHIVCPHEAMDDCWNVAKALSVEIKKHPFDLILTGVQAEDDGCGQVGASLAQIMGIPHASMVIQIEAFADPGSIIVKRELEEGYLETMRLRLPALLTIQTGINQPRYISVMRMRRFKDSSAIRKIDTDALELPQEKWEAKTAFRKFFSPPSETGRLEMIDGPPDQAASRLLETLKDKGVL